MWEIEKIVKHRMKKRTTEYLVKWKGFSEKDNTWEPEKQLKEDVPLLVQLYKEIINGNIKNSKSINQIRKKS